MKITIPTHYRVDYFLPRKRVPNSVLLRTTVDVSLNEVKDADAPVVHEIGQDQSPKHEGFVTPFKKIRGEPVKVRLYDGEYFYSIGTVADFLERIERSDFSNPLNGHPSEKGQPTSIIGLKENRESRKYATDFWTLDEYASSLDLDIRKSTSYLEGTIAMLNDRISKLIVVDGEVFDKVGEPILSLYDNGDRIELLLDVSRDVEHPLDRFVRRHDWMPSFGLDEYSRAVEIGLHMATQSGRPFVVHTDIRSVSPWLVRYRGEASYLSEIAQFFISHTHFAVQHMHPMLGVSWARLRDAVLDHSKLTQEMVDAATSICAVKSQLGDNFLRLQSPSSQSYCETVERCMAHLEHAVHVWNTRNSQSIEWVEKGLRKPSTFSDGLMVYEVTSLVDADRVSFDLGVDLTKLADEASTGACRLMVVEGDHRPLTVCSVVGSDDQPCIDQVVTRHGAQAPTAHLELVLQHVRMNYAPSLEIDEELLPDFSLSH